MHIPKASADLSYCLSFRRKERENKGKLVPDHTANRPCARNILTGEKRKESGFWHRTMFIYRNCTFDRMLGEGFATAM